MKDLKGFRAERPKEKLEGGERGKDNKDYR